MSTALTAYQEAAIAASAAREALLARRAELQAELGEIKTLLGRKKREPKVPKEKKTRKSKHGIELAQQA